MSASFGGSRARDLPEPQEPGGARAAAFRQRQSVCLFSDLLSEALARAMRDGKLLADSS